MKKLILSTAIALAALVNPVMAQNDLSGFYQTGTLLSGSVSNATTATADRIATNAITVITTNANSVITTNTTYSITKYWTIDTGWKDLALSPAGGVCPVDIQLFASNNSAILTNIILTLETTVNKRRPQTSTILVTNTPSAFSNSCTRVTIAAATFGNSVAFRLKSANNTGSVTNNIEVDYGYWRPKK